MLVPLLLCQTVALMLCSSGSLLINEYVSLSVCCCWVVGGGSVEGGLSVCCCCVVVGAAAATACGPCIAQDARPQNFARSNPWIGHMDRTWEADATVRLQNADLPSLNVSSPTAETAPA